MLILHRGSQDTASTLFWRIKEQPGLTVVEFSGELNEEVDFTGLRVRLKGKVVFHMGGVRRINSAGAREWVDFIQRLSSKADLTLTHCSPVVVAQLNMIHRFGGKARVISFYAPYACPHCDHEEAKLISVQIHFPGGDFTEMPQFLCSLCSGVMEFDEIVDRYTDFLQES